MKQSNTVLFLGIGAVVAYFLYKQAQAQPTPQEVQASLQATEVGQGLTALNTLGQNLMSM
jgi:hypothetical protein